MVICVVTDKQESSDTPQSPGRQLQVDLGSSVASLVNAVSKAIEEELYPHGLSSVDFSLLSHCYEREECNASELTGVLPVDASRVSRMVTVLVDRGLLRRRRLRNDRRVIMLRLSDDGQELTSMLRRRVRDLYDALAENISAEDMQVFVSVSSKIAENYEAMQPSE